MLVHCYATKGDFPFNPLRGGLLGLNPTLSIRYTCERHLILQLFVLKHSTTWHTKMISTEFFGLNDYVYLQTISERKYVNTHTNNFDLFRITNNLTPKGFHLNLIGVHHWIS